MPPRPPKRGATRAPARKQAPLTRSAPPGWLWLTAGLLSGLFIAFLVYLNQFDEEPPVPGTAEGGGQIERERRVAPARETREPAQEKGPAKEEKSAGSQPPQSLSYDFYKMLPEFEVAVPEEQKSGAKAAAPREVRPVEAPGRYVVQVGAFRNAKEAEALRVNLLLLNFKSTVTEGSDKSGAPLFRVRVGPYDDLTKLNEARARLADNGYNSSLFLRE